MINISLINKIYKYKNRYYKVTHISKIQDNDYIHYTFYPETSHGVICEKLDQFLDKFTPITDEDKIELL